MLSLGKKVFIASVIPLALAACDPVRVKQAHTEQSFVAERTVRCEVRAGYMPPFRRPAYRVVVLRDGTRVAQPILGGWSYPDPFMSRFGGQCDVSISGEVVCYGRQVVRAEVTPVTVTRESGRMETGESLRVIEPLSVCR